MKWCPDILEKHVAPGISRFTHAAIPPLDANFDQASYWAVNCFLNSALGCPWPDHYRHVVTAFLRRCSNAVSMYDKARVSTNTYLAGNDPLNPKIGDYFSALQNWEYMAIEVGIALDHFKLMNKGNGAFAKNDGSPEQRIYTIANQIKHLANCVRSGQCAISDSVPLWITDAGLHSFNASISYDEVLAILTDFAILCNELQDPMTFVRNTRAQQDASEDAASPRR